MSATSEPDHPQRPGAGPASRAGLGTVSMVLGFVAGAGSLLFALVAYGMSKESRGRSIEGAGDGSDEVLGAIGCVGAIFAAVAVAGLVLGGMALARPATPRGPARVGVALCALWLVLAGVVVLVAL
ncbi:MAG: hypothetical protein ACK53T_17575 [Planctomycetota bacterium]|jgi:hypothetical protein